MGLSKEKAERQIEEIQSKTGTTPVGQKLNGFFELCELADILSGEFGFIDSMVDARVGSVSIKATDFVFDHGVNNPFFEKAPNADLISFAQTGDDAVMVTLSVDNLWG